MFKIRRFASLVLILALLTTGGVYAAWNYADAQAKTVTTGISMHMESVSISTARGTYTIAPHTNSGFSGIVTIDQKAVAGVNGATTNDYTAVVKINGYITITFTPNVGVGAEEDVVDKGIETKAFLAFKQSSTQVGYPMDAEGNYDENGTPTQILTIDTTGWIINPVGTADAECWVANGDGSFSYVITADMIAEQVTLGETFILDTLSEYNAFSNILEGGSYTIGCVVQDPTASGTQQ